MPDRFGTRMPRPGTDSLYLASTVVLITFCLCLVAFVHIPEWAQQIVTVVVTTMLTLLVTIINFRFGSSADSRKKTEMIADGTLRNGNRTSRPPGEPSGDGGSEADDPAPDDPSPVGAAMGRADDRASGGEGPVPQDV